MKKRNLGLIAIISTLAISIVYAAPVKASIKDIAVQKATNCVPKGSKLIQAVQQDDEYEVRFYNKQTAEIYEVEVDSQTQVIKEFKSEKVKGVGSKSVKLTKEAIKTLVLKQHPNAQITKIELDTDDNLKVYEVKLSDNQIKGSLEINPETGVILERDFDVTSKKSTKPAPAKKTLGAVKAKEIVLKKIPGATITEIELDFEKGKYIYEIEAFKDGYEYELKIDATTGAGIYLHKEVDDWFDDDKYDNDQDDDDTQDDDDQDDDDSQDDDNDQDEDNDGIDD